MLYGRLVYGKPGKPKGFVNVGDYYQTFGIDLIYEYLKIDSDKIVDIDRHAIHSYDGEDLILPLNAWFGYEEDSKPLSDRIHPVYIGYHNMGKVIPGMEKCGPIGCRDEATYNFMKKEGIDAYISGCMTVLFPKREKEPEKEHIFIVDLPQNVTDKIPDHIKKNATYVTHEIRIQNKDGSQKSKQELEQISRDIMDRYKKEATLVITSRLHCAMICMAMGINVIVLRDSVDERFLFIDKFLKIHTLKDIDSVDWNGQKVELENFKKELIKYAASVIEGHDDSQYRNKLHEYYMDRDYVKIQHSFKVVAYEKLHKHFPNLADFIREKILFKYTIAYNRDNNN